MNKILLNILREIGIAIGILVVLAAVIVIAFKDQLPYDEVIPSGEKYEVADLKQFSVSSTDRISEINAVTITHETNQRQIVSAEDEVRIQTGKYTPFGTIDNTTDLPSERVGISVTPQKESSESQDTETNENGEEVLDYNSSETAVSDKDVQKIADDQAESSESAAARRFGNVD